VGGIVILMPSLPGQTSDLIERNAVHGGLETGQSSVEMAMQRTVREGREADSPARDTGQLQSADTLIPSVRSAVHEKAAPHLVPSPVRGEDQARCCDFIVLMREHPQEPSHQR
jgi:hypothetical protein